MSDDSVRQSPLAMDVAAFRALGHRLVDQLAEFPDALPHGPVTRDESPSAVRPRRRRQIEVALNGP